MIKVQLNDKAAGITKLHKIQKYWFTVCSPKSGELYFVNIFSTNKVTTLCSADYGVMFVKLHY
jgi:hypothetical protein